MKKIFLSLILGLSLLNANANYFGKLVEFNNQGDYYSIVIETYKMQQSKVDVEIVNVKRNELVKNIINLNEHIEFWENNTIDYPSKDYLICYCDIKPNTLSCIARATVKGPIFPQSQVVHIDITCDNYTPICYSNTPGRCN